MRGFLGVLEGKILYQELQIYRFAGHYFSDVLVGLCMSDVMLGLRYRTSCDLWRLGRGCSCLGFLRKEDHPIHFDYNSRALPPFFSQFVAIKSVLTLCTMAYALLAALRCILVDFVLSARPSLLADP